MAGPGECVHLSVHPPRAGAETRKRSRISRWKQRDISAVATNLGWVMVSWATAVAARRRVETMNASMLTMGVGNNEGGCEGVVGQQRRH